MAYGWNRRWHGGTWWTYTLDDHGYWTIHPVINRKPRRGGLEGLTGARRRRKSED
jgi:hypothetical protein